MSRKNQSCSNGHEYTLLNIEHLIRFDDARFSMIEFTVAGKFYRDFNASPSLCDKGWGCVLPFKVIEEAHCHLHIALFVKYRMVRGCY